MESLILDQYPDTLTALLNCREEEILFHLNITLARLIQLQDRFISITRTLLPPNALSRSQSVMYSSAHARLIPRHTLLPAEKDVKYRSNLLSLSFNHLSGLNSNGYGNTVAS